MIGMADITSKATQFGFTLEGAVEALGGSAKIIDGALYVSTSYEKKALGRLTLTAPNIEATRFATKPAAPAAVVKASAPTSAPARAVRFGTPTHCHFCGGRWAVTLVHDMSGLPGYVCGHHSSDFAEGFGSFC